MRILFVELTNFGPFHGTHRFNLVDRGLLLVMGDNLDEPRMNSNGSGKSHIFDALDWCLWGENPRGDHAEAMVNDEVAKVRGSKCAVRVKLEADSGSEIDIIRTRTKSKLDLEVMADGTIMSTLDTKESQKVIEQLLGLDREVFHAAVLFGQQDLTHYADVTDAQRMGILTRLLQLDEIDQYLERMKARLKSAGERKAKIQADLAGVDGQLAAIRPEDFDAEVAKWDQDNKASIDRLHSLLGQKTTEHQTLKAQAGDAAHLQAQKDAVDGEVAAMQAPPEPLEVEQARLEVEKAQNSVTTVAAEMDRHRNELARMQNQGVGVCSQCRQPVTAEHLQNEAQRLQELLQQAEESYRRVSLTLQGAKDHREAVNRSAQEAKQAWQATRDQKVQESANLGAQIQAMANILRQIEALEREMVDLNCELNKAQAATNPFRERRAQAEKERYDLERKRGQIQYEIEALGVDIQHLEFWVHGLGPKGLKSYILDSRLQELTDAANEWMRILTGGTMWVRFESQKVTRGKKVVNAPDLKVARWNPDGTITERSYRSWSGGEKKRISFAVDFGLSRLVARRATQRYDLLILDEAFRHLDRAGKEAVMEMLQALAYEKSSLIVVEHDSEFQGQFERRVLVTKHNRRSTIKELDHVHEKTEAEEGVSGDLPADPHRERPRRTPVRRPVT